MNYKESLDRPLPANTELERLVLGCVLLTQDVWPQVSVLTNEDFFLPTHYVVYERMAAMWHECAPIDLMTVIEALRTAGDLERAGGQVYICSLIDGCPRYTNVEQYVKDLQKLKKWRKLARLGSKLIEEGLTREIDPDEIRSAARAELAALDSGSRRGKKLPEFADEALARQVLPGISTGFDELDKLLRGGGYIPGDFIVYAGRTGGGKSTLAMQTAGAICDRYDWAYWKNTKKRSPVGLYVSLESDNEDVVDRILTMDAELSYESLQLMRFTPDEQNRRMARFRRMLEWNLTYLDYPYVSVDMAVNEAEYLIRAEKGLDFIVLDYLGLITTSQEKEEYDVRNRISKITREIKLAAGYLKTPIIVPVQINREGVKNEGRMRAEHLRDCGTIENDATKILIVQRSEDYSSPTGYYADITLEKQRRGTVGHVRSFVNRKSGSRFEMVAGSAQFYLPELSGAQTTYKKATGKTATKKASVWEKAMRDSNLEEPEQDNADGYEVAEGLHE